MWFKVSENPPELNTMIEITIGDKQLVLANCNKVLHCFENRCPHEDFQLTLGCIQNNNVKCSLHGFSFDLTTGESSEQGVESLRLFRVKTKDKAIYIDMSTDQ